MERLDNDRQRQAGNLKQKLAERRKQKQEALKRKQEAEMAKELLEQKKEISEARTRAVKEAEKEAMLNAIRENGSEASEYIIRKVGNCTIYVRQVLRYLIPLSLSFYLFTAAVRSVYNIRRIQCGLPALAAFLSHNEK